MNLEAIVFALLGYCLISSVFFLYSTHRLLNKLMSRNYFEFTQSENYKKTEVEKPQKVTDNDDDTDNEDMAHLTSMI